MKDSITTLLEDLSARLGCDVLTEDSAEQTLNEEFSETRHRVAVVADEVRQLASTGDALNFAGELSAFLEASRSKALEANRLRAAIAERQLRLTEAQEELGYLSAGRAALAEKVKHAMLALEQAQREYADHELRLGVVERNIEATRLERSALRRQLEVLTKTKEERN